MGPGDFLTAAFITLPSVIVGTLNLQQFVSLLVNRLVSDWASKVLGFGGGEQWST
jgi:hypothetical protein